IAQGRVRRSPMLKRFAVALRVLATSGSASAATVITKTVPKSWKSDYGDHFEAGYSATGTTTYTPDATAGLNGDKLGIESKLTAWVRLFDSKSNIAELRGIGYTNVNGTRDYDVELWAWIGTFKVRLLDD